MNDWARYCFDRAVTTFGRIVENALQERENIASEEKPEYVNKYTLAQLLTPGFALERNQQPRGDIMDKFSRIEGFGLSEVR